MKHECKRCGGVWDTPIEFPKTCGLCGSPLWSKDRKRAHGAGRKPKGKELATTAGPGQKKSEPDGVSNITVQAEENGGFRPRQLSEEDRRKIAPSRVAGSDTNKDTEIHPTLRRMVKKPKRDHGPNTKAERVEADGQRLVVDPEAWEGAE